MPRRLLRATPARLTAFDCPRRYRFTYVDRPAPAKGPAWAHTTVGSVAHVTLHRWWDAEPARRDQRHASRLLDRYWRDDGFRDPAQAEAMREIVRGWIESYLGALDPADEPRGVERTVGARTERLALSGRVDRIDERDGELVIVDYKTGRYVPGPDDARASLALALYALAGAALFRVPCTLVELHHLPTGTVAAARHTDQSLARHLARAEATADDIAAAQQALESGADPDDAYPPSPGSSCGWCDFRRHCPDGMAASAERAPWDGLPDAVR
jgi:CRISPR/Cas system-associated exonuclease Cas4 (RecB family)